MAYVFRRGWTKAYRRSRPPVVASGSIQITLTAAIGSFMVATIPATFDGGLASGAGNFGLSGNLVALNLSEAVARATFSVNAMAAGFKVTEAAGLGSFAVTGSASGNFLRVVAAPGGLIWSGLPSPGSTALSAGATSFTVAGTASSYERDFEAWVGRPFETIAWRPDVTVSMSNWTDLDPSADAWTGTVAPTSAWTPAAIHPEPWRTE